MRAKLARFGGFKSVEALENRVLFSLFPSLSAPSGLSVAARTSTTAILGWNPEFVIGETGFLIERSTDAIDWVTAVIAPADSRTWLDADLEADTTYLYRIASFNNTETSYAASEAAVTTPADSFADIDSAGSLFIRRTEGTDVIRVELAGTSILVDVGVDSDFFANTLVRRIRILQSDTDNGVTIDRIFNSGSGVVLSNALTVRGTLGNDLVGVSGDTDFLNVKVNGAVMTFSRTLVNRINILTYDGDDRVSITDDVGGVNVNSGAGNDIIFSGLGDDRLNGGPGDDLIKGNAGNDIIFGDSGNDTAYGQAGNDALHGGDGDDRLVGGIGNDILYGEAGNDRLYGEEGVDTLLGGTGFNFLKQN